MIGKTRQDDAPRGVLVPRFETGAFRHQRGAPGAALAALVEHYWYVGWDLQGKPPQVQETLPHPSVHFVVEHDTAGIYGVHTARFTRQLQGQGFAFGIKFRPGGFRPFLGAAVASISGQCLAPAAVFGAPAATYIDGVRALAARASLAQQDAGAMMALAEAFLLARLPPADPAAQRASALVAAIAADPGLLSVQTLAQQAGSNKRALQRLFQEYVGVGPKWVIQRYRLHEAVARLQAGDAPSLAQLALELGYFDQAHFVRDFTALVGRPPGAYARAI